jgi:isoquinoline 1-oxidoreductase alpha subunit
MPTYSFRVNGQPHEIEAPGAMPLLWVVRDLIGLTGSKYGCGRGQCGACTMLVDGEPVRTCTRRVELVDGAEITTIEGLSPDGSHPVQKAWIAEAVPQCGYCQSGQLMSAAALLERTPNPSDDEIDVAMSRNICRCGTYQRVRAAIHRAATEA